MNQRLHIIHTNDLHSHFGNMKKISTYIKDEKKKAMMNNDHLIVIDLGDHMDRMHIETEGTFGKVNVEVLNHWEVDMITIGNNEGLTFTKEHLTEAYKNREFKIVLCNLKDAETKTTPEWMTEYWIQELDGLRIGWIGATAPYEIFYGLQGWCVQEPLPKIKNIVNEIKNQTDIIVLLSHLGIRSDERIAELLKDDIDVILGAHTHRFYESGIKKEGYPLICQVGIFGEYVGHVTIDYNKEMEKIESIKEKTVSIKTFEEDPTIVQLLDQYKIKAKKELSSPVASLNRPLPVSIDKESPLTNLLADGVRNWVNADISIINNGQLLEGLEKGIVTKERIHHICPSPINTCTVMLSGSQIKMLLEQSLLDEFKYSSLNGYGFRGGMLGSLSVSGLEIEYDLSKPPYQKITNISVNNSLLIEDVDYKVGTLDMFTFGGGYSLIKEGRDFRYFLPEFIRDILAYQLKSEESISESFKNRWYER